MPQLRTSVGVGLAVLWNLPLVLLFWYDWVIVLRVISANCLLWALGLLVLRNSPGWRSWFFRSADVQPEHRWRFTGMAVWMLVLGGVALTMSFFQRSAR